MAPCSTALKYFQYPAGEWDSSSCLLSSFRSCRSYSSFHSLSPHPPSLSLFIYLSVYPCRSRLFFAVASSQSSFMPPGGEDLITHGEWISRSPRAEGSRRCLKFSLLDASRYFSLSYFFTSITCSLFLKSLFTRHVSEEPNRALLESNVLWLNIRATMSRV